MSEGPDISGTSNRAMFAYSSSYQRRTLDPQVLVEATPSHSGSSQSQEDACRNLSEPMEATQILDEPEMGVRPDIALDADDNASGYESSEPTSSFGRLLDGIDDPELDGQPTQPSTQHHTSNPASGPRSLISLVRPENQWRYQQYQQPKQIMPSIHDHQSHSRGHISSLRQETQPSHPAQSHSNGGHISSFGQETQPSHPVHSSTFSNPPYLAPKVSSHHGRDRPPLLGSPLRDAMDIVPDSEPMCSDQRHATLTTNRPSKAPSTTEYNSNGNNEACQDVTMGNFESRCPPEDQGDEMDEEEDVPLAVMSRNQAIGKAGPKAVNQRKGKAPQKTVHTAPSSKQNLKVR